MWPKEIIPNYKTNCYVFTGHKIMVGNAKIFCKNYGLLRQWECKFHALIETKHFYKRVLKECHGIM